MRKIMFNDQYGLTKAVLEGRKTQTRRFINPQPPVNGCELAWLIDSTDKNDKKHENPCKWLFNGEEVSNFFKPSFKVGDIAAIAQCYNDIPNIYSLITMLDPPLKNAGWRNKMFVKPSLMPYSIRFKDVRSERLQDITDNDCLKEGIVSYTKDETVNKYSWINSRVPWADMPRSPREAFANLIDRVNRRGTWDSNPWVWRYEFELVKNEQP